MGENLKTEMNNVFAAVLDTHFHAERADLKKTRTTKDLSYLMITTQPLFSPFFFLFFSTEFGIYHRRIYYLR